LKKKLPPNSSLDAEETSSSRNGRTAHDSPLSMNTFVSPLCVFEVYTKVTAEVHSKRLDYWKLFKTLLQFQHLRLVLLRRRRKSEQHESWFCGFGCHVCTQTRHCWIGKSHFLAQTVTNLLFNLDFTASRVTKCFQDICVG